MTDVRRHASPRFARCPASVVSDFKQSYSAVRHDAGQRNFTPLQGRGCLHVAPVYPRSLRRGVTLLEIMLSMGILVVLSSMTYWFYGSALRTRDEDAKVLQDLQAIRVVSQRLAQEIRQASMISSGGRKGIRGEPERIWLSTLRVPAKSVHKKYDVEDPPPGEYDLIKVEYKIARHPDLLHEDDYPEALGLARIEHRVPRPDSAETGDAYEDRRGGKPSGSGEASGDAPEATAPEEFAADDPLFKDERGPQIGVDDEIRWEELYSKEIRYLRFCYFDGYRWWDAWDVGGENPLPQLVQATIGLKSHPPLDASFGTADEDAQEYCTCMNREPQDCLPTDADQFTFVVRVTQADPLFRSRVGREIKALTDQSGAPQGKKESGK